MFLGSHFSRTHYCQVLLRRWGSSSSYTNFGLHSLILLRTFRQIKLNWYIFEFCLDNDNTDSNWRRSRSFIGCRVVQGWNVSDSRSKYISEFKKKIQYYFLHTQLEFLSIIYIFKVDRCRSYIHGHSASKLDQITETKFGFYNDNKCYTPMKIA